MAILITIESLFLRLNFGYDLVVVAGNDIDIAYHRDQTLGVLHCTASPTIC